MSNRVDKMGHKVISNALKIELLIFQYTKAKSKGTLGGHEGSMNCEVPFGHIFYSKHLFFTELSMISLAQFLDMFTIMTLLSCSSFTAKAFPRGESSHGMSKASSMQSLQSDFSRASASTAASSRSRSRPSSASRPTWDDRWAY